MVLRILDRFEEVLISALMAAAVALIFVTVIHRLSLTFAADLIGYGRRHDMAWLQANARSAFATLNAIRLTWAQEACIYLFVWMAKFGAAYGVRIGIHVGVDLVVQKLTGKAKQNMMILAMAGGIIFTAILVWIGFDFVWHVKKGGQISADLEIKMWIVYLAVPVGSALMCFRFIQALWLYMATGYVAHHDLASVEGIEEEAVDLAEGGHG